MWLRLWLIGLFCFFGSMASGLDRVPGTEREVILVNGLGTTWAQYRQGTEGEYVSNHCAAATLSRLVVSCVNATAELTGFDSWNDFRTVQADETLWLPLREPGLNRWLEAYAAGYQIVGSAGLSSEFRAEINAMLDPLVTRMGLVEIALENLPDSVTPGQLQGTETRLRAVIADLPAGVSNIEVQMMIAEAFARANLPNQAAVEAVQSAQATLRDRVSGLAATVQTKADMSAVEALRREFNTKLAATTDLFDADLGPAGRVHDLVVSEVKDAVTDKVTADLAPNRPIHNLVVNEVTKAVDDALSAQAAARPLPPQTATESGIVAFVRQNVVTLLLIALALGVLAVIVSLLSATTRRPVRLVEETVTVTPVTTDAGPAVAVMATIAPAPAVLPDTFAENARAVSTATQQEVDELTERVGILEDGLESTSRLVLLQFEREHGLLPLQVFPSQKQIDALEVGRTIVLSFEKDGHHYNLWLTKESNFLHLRGLVGRTDVVLANATSLERHIVRVFKAQGKASIEKAFLPVTAVSAQAA